MKQVGESAFLLLLRLLRPDAFDSSQFQDRIQELDEAVEESRKEIRKFIPQFDSCCHRYGLLY